MSFLEIIGAIAISYLVIVGVHEFGHYYVIKQDGGEIRHVCLMGWNENAEHGYSAWVQSKGEIDRTWHNWWDDVWSVRYWLGWKE